MDQLKSLVAELHRRSLWQVLGIFLAASWGVIEVVDLLTEQVGLPDWTPTMALVLLLIGLPVVLATAVVQEGMPGADARDADGGAAAGSGAGAADPATAEPVNLAAGTGSLDRPSTRPSQTKRLFTWKNAILGGLGAFTLLGLSLFVYFVMWTSGIGPVGNLVAQGIIEEGEPILLAEFENTSDDASLGGMVTEALRVDLASSQTITLVEPGRVSDLLELMEEDPDTPVQGELANEVAVRGGIKAVVEGEVGSAGSGYILVATIRATESGRTLATFRRTASGPDEVIAAIDGLSQDIREKAGESLRSIKAEEPLEDVTTASLDALRLYSEAEELEERGAHPRALALLREALELDPEFAMAWRKLAVVMQDGGGSPQDRQDAATRAYELRHRLTERERYQAVAYYHQEVTGNISEQMRAYHSILDRFPDDRSALNNLSIAYSNLAKWEEALELLDRAVSGPGASGPAYTNRVLYYALSGDFEGGQQALDELVSRYPDRDLWNSWVEFVLRYSEWDADRVVELGAVLAVLPNVGPNWHAAGARMPGLAAALEGRMDDTQRFLNRAMTLEREADRRYLAAVAAMDLAKSERLAGTGRDRQVLRDLLASGDFQSAPGPTRDYARLGSELAESGLPDEALALLEEWATEGGPTAAGPFYEVSRAAAEAGVLGLSDPGAGADALLALRGRADCPRCWTWQIGNLLTEAGRIDEAIQERTRSLEAGEDFWFGMHRLMAREKLGRLYEAKGDVAAAAEHYAVFAEQWADADPELQPRVEHARRVVQAGGS